MIPMIRTGFRTSPSNGGGLPESVVSYTPIVIPPATKLGGGGGVLDSPCLSVCLSVCPYVCPLTFGVRPVASTVQDGFFSIFGTNDQ